MIDKKLSIQSLLSGEVRRGVKRVLATQRAMPEWLSNISDFDGLQLIIGRVNRFDGIFITLHQPLELHFPLLLIDGLRRFESLELKLVSMRNPTSSKTSRD